MLKDSSKSDQTWMIVFGLVPTLILTKYPDLFEFTGLNRILAATLLGVIGGAIGIGVFQWVKSKNAVIKIVAISSIAFFGFLGFFLSIQYQKSLLKTCEVCGYIAVKGNECQVCLSDSWESIDYKDEYKDKEEWLRDEQVFWFEEVNFTDSMFYYPEVEEGFVKDKNWHPIITAKDFMQDSHSH